MQRAATELGYVPDSAARALSVRLKEVVGVVMRRRVLRSDLGDLAELQTWLGAMIQRLADG